MKVQLFIRSQMAAKGLLLGLGLLALTACGGGGASTGETSTTATTATTTTSPGTSSTDNCVKSTKALVVKDKNDRNEVDNDIDDETDDDGKPVTVQTPPPAVVTNSSTDCTTGTTGTTGATTTTLDANGVQGKALWAQNCAACHGGQTSFGQNANNTLNAIATNKGGMGFLAATIGATQANQIAVYAANPGAY